MILMDGFKTDRDVYELMRNNRKISERIKYHEASKKFSRLALQLCGQRYFRSSGVHLRLLTKSQQYEFLGEGFIENKYKQIVSQSNSPVLVFYKLDSNDMLMSCYPEKQVYIASFVDALMALTNSDFDYYQLPCEDDPEIDTDDPVVDLHLFKGQLSPFKE